MKRSLSSRPRELLQGSLAWIILFLALGVGWMLGEMKPWKGLILSLLFLLFCASFLWPEGGLMAVIFSMLLSPEVIVGDVGSRGATLGRGVTLRLEDLLLVCIGLSWLARSAVLKDTGLIRHTPLNKAIGTYILVCALATLWGMVWGNVRGVAGFFYVLKYFEYMVVFFMVVNYTESAAQAERLLFCVLAACFLACLAGLWQIPTGARVSAPFEGEVGEPNTFGGYLVFMGAIAAAMLESAKNARIRTGLTGLVCLIVVNLLYTQSRSSYLAVFPAFLVLAAFSRFKVHLLGGLVLLFALSPWILPGAVKERAAYTFSQPTETGQLRMGNLRLDTSTSARIVSWQEGVKVWWKRPILGHGVTGYHFLDTQYPRILVETGLLGFAAFCLLIFTLIRFILDAWRRARSDPLTRSLAVGALAGLTGLLVHAVGTNSFIIVRIMEPFWAIMGILFVLTRARQDEWEASTA